MAGEDSNRGTSNIGAVTNLHLDFETRSELNLKDVGAYAYFEHPSTTILCAGYSVGDEEPHLWVPGDSIDVELFYLAQENIPVAAWNANFERLAWRHIMHGRWGFPEIEDKRWQCTMTEALSMNLPGQLKDAAPALGMTMVKDDLGHRLMMKMCKPRKPRKDEPQNATFWHDSTEELKRLGEYCLQDVRVEKEISKRILRMRPSETELYLLDMRINDRGVRVDKKLCEIAEEIVKSATLRLDKEMERITNNEVSACSNVYQLTKWLKSRGVNTESIDRESIEDLLIMDIPDDCKRALELRQEGSKTSTAKIASMMRRCQKDGRMRGNVQFYGASATGRWAARGAQLHNLTRPKILGSEIFEPVPLEQQIETALSYLETKSSMVVELVYGQPLTLVSDCIRSMIIVDDGKVLRSSDFSNIEGRVIAWLASQLDKLQAFKDYDEGRGPDLYLVAASGIFGVPVEEAKKYRQIGKVAELALGFQGGPKAFAKMAKNYGVHIAQQYGIVWNLAKDEFKEQAENAWEHRGYKTGMSKEGWLASEVIKLAWRAKNWRIEHLWEEVENAAISAVKNPGKIYTAGKVKYKKSGSFLFCQLPSGRALCYPYARLQQKQVGGETREQLIYKSTDQFTKKWSDKTFYGGLGVENITQAVARDIMAEAMLRVEKTGYSVVLTVHDEIITEDREDFGSIEEFNALMRENPAWAKDLPINVGGWQGKRYRKG